MNVGTIVYKEFFSNSVNININKLYITFYVIYFYFYGILYTYILSILFLYCNDDYNSGLTVSTLGVWF